MYLSKCKRLLSEGLQPAPDSPVREAILKIVSEFSQARAQAIPFLEDEPIKTVLVGGGALWPWTDVS
jgi:hypothetical protein